MVSGVDFRFRGWFPGVELAAMVRGWSPEVELAAIFGVASRDWVVG